MKKDTTIEMQAAKIKLLVLDVDGVLTDGHVMLTEKGEEIKSFNIKDGLGLKMLIEAGIEVVLITGRSSKALAHRAKELGIERVCQGVMDKGSILAEIMNEKKLQNVNVCSVGDDLPDLPLFSLSGISVAVADAAPELKGEAMLVTKSRGGNGAVREVCELILKAKGKWPRPLSGRR